MYLKAIAKTKIEVESGETSLRMKLKGGGGVLAGVVNDL
jgi:hypothetical protein